MKIRSNLHCNHKIIINYIVFLYININDYNFQIVLVFITSKTIIVDFY